MVMVNPNLDYNYDYTALSPIIMHYKYVHYAL